MIEANNICFWYKKNVPVLSNISFKVKNGENVFILGPNGSGKTTLLICLCGIMRPKDGEAYLDGKNIGNMSAVQRAKRIGYVPQMGNDVFGTEAIDIIMMGRSAGTGRRLTENDKEAVFRIIEKMEIEKLIYKKINEMSGGERKKVFIARALAQEPDVMILDEPTAALDIKNQFETMKFLTSLAHKRNIAVIMSAHDLNIAALFADKIIMLKGSRIYKYGSPKETITNENIKSVYGIEVYTEEKSGGVQNMLKKQ